MCKGARGRGEARLEACYSYKIVKELRNPDTTVTGCQYIEGTTWYHRVHEMISRLESSEDFENDNIEGFGVPDEHRLDVVDADIEVVAAAGAGVVFYIPRPHVGHIYHS